MDWHQIAYPYLKPGTPVVDAVVHRAKTAEAKTVMVAGETVLRDGYFTRVNKDEALEELAASLRQPLTPEEKRRQQLGREVFPHVQRFYDGWLDKAEREPFYQPSSRR